MEEGMEAMHQWGIIPEQVPTPTYSLQLPTLKDLWQVVSHKRSKNKQTNEGSR